MSIRARLQWIGFVLYVAVFFALPLSLLWNVPGLVAGLSIASFFLYAIRVRGTERILNRLSVSRLRVADAPYLHGLVGEYCRRLNIPRPQLGVIDTPAINLAVVGFSRRKATLVITRGAMDLLKRSQLSALLGRQLTLLWHGEVGGQSWLAQFLSVLDWVVGSPQTNVPPGAGRQYPVSLVIKQIIFYPLALIPIFLLRSRNNPSHIDVTSVRLTGKPQALAEGMRLLEALSMRSSYFATLSTRHLFLVGPPSKDPLMRVFFDADPLSERIMAIEALMHKVANT
jgi:heat shock protein HtpX